MEKWDCAVVFRKLRKESATLELRPKFGQLRRKKSNKSKEIGVVANEVEKVVPELVDEYEDEQLGTVKTMKYANTVGLLIEAVKDLSKQIEELKNGSTN